MMKRILGTVGHVIMLILVYMAFQLCFTFVSMFVAVLYAAFKGYITVDGIADIGNYSSMLSTPDTNSIYVGAMAVGLLLSSLAMLLFLHLVNGYRLQPGFLRSMQPRPLFYSTMLVFTSIFSLNILVQWFGLKDNVAELLDGLTHNVVGVLTVALVAPLLEEVMFRGAIQGYMLRRHSPAASIVCAALVFGIFHLNPIQSVYATLIGLVFGWIYYRTGSLLSVILGHVLNNSMAVVTALVFPADKALPFPNGLVSSAAQLASEIMGFVFFGLLSVYFAVKLHRSLPPVQQPWRDVSDVI